MPAHLSVLCTNGLRAVLLAVGDDLQSKARLSFTAEYGSTKKFSDRIAAGAAPDIAILTDAAIEELLARGHLSGARVDVARSFIGVAVRKGAPRPPIDTPAAFVETLRNARSISRSRLGASGQHFASLLDRLSLADELAPKIKAYDGYAGQACANGEVEIAIQQISELMPIEGLDVVGPLPAELQKISVFSGAIGAASRQRDAANAFLAYLASRDIAPVLRANGLEPA